MIIGNPYQFSIFVNDIKEWNTDGASFRNGVLLFCIDGELFPKQVVTATLNCEIRPLKEMLMNLAINEELYNMEKERAFIEMYNITFPEGDSDNDYRYDISPSSFSDIGYYIFAVSNSKQIRIMAAKLNYVINNSKHDFKNIDISETFITIDELSKIILKLDIVSNQRTDSV